MSIALQKIAGAVLFALILTTGLNLLVDGLMPHHVDHPAPDIAASEGGFDPSQIAARAPAGATGTGMAAAPGDDRPLGVRLATAKVADGQAVARKCQSCHGFDQGGGAKVGPNLFGVVGRKKGSFPGFPYSDGFKSQSGVWTDEDLDKFLTKPSAFIAGTKMTFAGLPNGTERAAVIAYLRSISPDAPPPPAPE